MLHLDPHRIATMCHTLAGAFGGLLAAAISNMDGIGGKPAWAWIFIIEGLATIVAGIASIWVVQDFPDTAKFLTEAERTFIIRRLQRDDQFSASGENFRMRSVVSSLRDWKTWFGRFRATAANLLVVPVYAFASIVTCCVALYADKYGRRVYVATCGIFPVVPNTIAWIANNFEGSYKRGVSLAMAISMGNLNGAVSSNVYRARDQPWYPLGELSFLPPVTNLIFHRTRGQRDEIIGQNSSGEDGGNGRFATVEERKGER
ncbi:major facilitator superfamily domain-containing protein [Mycena leptocephala]|nr:major facilitator superfamily domain-containing protein [Mycena leptocephala]